MDGVIWPRKLCRVFMGTEEIAGGIGSVAIVDNASELS